MALVEKNDNLKGKTVRMQDGLVLSWEDAEDDDAVEFDILQLEKEDKLAEKKILKTKNDNLKTKKVII